MTLPIQLTLPAVARSQGARIDVGGVDLAKACRGVIVRASVDEITTVELDLISHETTQVDGEARVIIPRHTHEALAALGWAPPGTVQLAWDLVDAAEAMRMRWAEADEQVRQHGLWQPLHRAADELRGHLDGITTTQHPQPGDDPSPDRVKP